MPRNARLAVLFSFLLHGVLILAARYRLSYDAYNHMFFGDHYRLDWWSLWEPRWYTGFYVNSYPPLVHQLIGGLSHLIGLDAAFALILWIALTVLPLAVYSFAKIFVGKTSAGYAALGAAFLPSVYLTGHIFGQLPTLAGTVAALFGAAALNRYLRAGNRFDGVLTVSLLSTVMAFHHATLMLLPWLVLAITFHLLLTKQIHWQAIIVRLVIVGIFSIAAMLMVMRSMRVPEVVAHLFDYAERDRIDETTEYGGVIDLDERNRFEIHEFPPRIRTHDRQFNASQEMFDAGYTAVFHFHFHAQEHRNAAHAGPGLGDDRYADATRANCLVFTFKEGLLSPIANDLTHCATMPKVEDLSRDFVKNVFKGDPRALQDLAYDRRQAFIRAHPYPSDIPTVSFATSSSSPLSVTAKATEYMAARYGVKSDGLVAQVDPGGTVTIYVGRFEEPPPPPAETTTDIVTDTTTVASEDG